MYLADIALHMHSVRLERLTGRAAHHRTATLHGDDQIVPIAASAPLSVKLLKKGALKVYEKFPHGMCTTHPDVINLDLLAFVRARQAADHGGSSLTHETRRR